MRMTRSKLIDAIRSTASGLHAAGAIDLATMRRIDRLTGLAGSHGASMLVEVSSPRSRPKPRARRRQRK